MGLKRIFKKAAVLQSTAEEIRCSYDPDSEEPNRVVIFIKE